MNILLVGGSCSLMDSMILKLRKEGHRVFLLTGDKYRHNKYQKVFERYDFAYDCENLNDILESVNADVTILLGAFDTNYRWNGEERETVHFISHLVNILVAYSMANKKRLIFLSSDEIYNGNYKDDIEEEEKFSGIGIRADALSQAEENLQVSKNRYEVGLETITNFMEAQAQWQKAWSDWIDARTELRLNETYYLKATGRLTD